MPFRCRSRVDHASSGFASIQGGMEIPQTDEARYGGPNRFFGGHYDSMCIDIILAQNSSLSLPLSTVAISTKAVFSVPAPPVPPRMFKKDLTSGSKTKVKSSVQRGIRSKVLETYPLLEPHIDDILPKKSQLDLAKLPDRVSLYSLDDKPLFWQHMDDPIVPHLKIVHQYPHAFKTIRIDRGAIRFVMSGATLMAPGLTSAGGRLPDKEDAFEKGQVVAVGAEGKEEICLIGMLEMGTEEMKAKKKGPAMSQGHYLGDGLWKIDLN